jgi:hypothetical protein
MRLNSFTIEGYKNLTAPITFGPLDDLNALHGPNSVGKSNLLGAIDLFFRLLGVGNHVTRDQLVTMDANEQIEGHPFDDIFNVIDPVPIRWQARLLIPKEELQEAGIEPECPTDVCTISLELSPVAKGAQLRVTQFQMGGIDVGRETAPLGSQAAFAQTLRAYIAGTYFMQTERSVRSFVLLDPYRREPDQVTDGGLVPQRVRDDLFDARQSLERERRSRWTLFAHLMGELEPELGPGQFETAFDRSTGRANLVFESGESAMAIDRLGAGVQRMVAVLGSLVLVRAGLVGFAEPELGLTPSLQQRLHRAVQTILATPGGPSQLFYTTHSPVLAVGDHTFAMSIQEGAPTVEQRSWEGADVLPPLPDRAPPAAGTRADPEDLDALIGLVDQLSEMEPSELVPAGTGAARPQSPPTRPANPPAATQAPPPGTPPWKWQPKR